MNFLFCFLIPVSFAQEFESPPKTETESKISPVLWEKIFPQKNMVIPNGVTEEAPETIEVYVDFSRGEALENIPGEIQNIDEDFGLAVVEIPVNQLLNLAEKDEVKTIREIIPPIVWTGTINSEGDSVLNSDDVRNAFTKSGGAGITIGVISDGVDHLANAQATANAPSVTVLRNSWGGDEGTAMIEIIHDLAPNATILFYDHGSNSLEFNGALDALVAAGADIVVDDIWWPGEPSFEDGVIASHFREVAQETGVLLISSAGNSAEDHHQKSYTGDGVPRGSLESCHVFGSADSGKYLLTIPNGDFVYVMAHWNEDWGSASNNYNLFLSNANGAPFALGDLGKSESLQTGTQNPFEYVAYTNSTGSTITAQVDLCAFNANETHEIEIYVYHNGYGTTASGNNIPANSIMGHAAVPEVMAVGAVYHGTPSTIESYSSQGPITLIGETRQKPDIVGIDGVSITGVGGFGSSCSGNPCFFGTSAAAPHIAAVAAQLWSRDPSKSRDDIRALIQNNAVDLGSAGFDPVFGHGRADTLAAMTAQMPHSGDIRLNEIAWAGSSASTADEWIELRNMTDEAIDLSGFQIVQNGSLMLTIPDGKSIPANGYFLIANYDASSGSSTLSVVPDLVTTSVNISNTALQIRLYDGNFTAGAHLLDTAGNGGLPLAGSNATPKASMARKFMPGDGTQTYNWFTHQLSFGFDGGTQEKGSPGNSSSSFVEAFPETVYEDGDQNYYWWAYDKTPSAPSALSHSLQNGRIVFSGNGIDNGWKTWAQNTEQFIAQWDWILPEGAGAFYWQVDTNAGTKYIQYNPTDDKCRISNSRNYFICGVGSEIADGSPHTLKRDLQADITRLDPSVMISKVTGMLVRGNTEVGNLKLLSHNEFNTISGNIKIDGVNANKVKVFFMKEGGGIAPMPVETDLYGNYSQYGFEPSANYSIYVEYIYGGIAFANNSRSINIDSSNIVENFIGTSGAEIVYEDGVNKGSYGWVVHDISPSTPTYPIVSYLGGYLQVMGNGLANGFKKTFASPDTVRFNASWNWLIEDADQGVFYWLVDTDINEPGQRSSKIYVQYVPNNDPCYWTDWETGDHHVICGVGSEIANQNWHTTTRNLITDINIGLSNSGKSAIVVNRVLGVLQRGNMKIDNIKLSQ